MQMKRCFCLSITVSSIRRKAYTIHGEHRPQSIKQNERNIAEH